MLNVKNNRFRASNVPIFDPRGNRGRFDFDMSLQHLSNISYDVRVACLLYTSGSLTFPFGDMECRLTASVIVYRRREQLPEGDRDAIACLLYTSITTSCNSRTFDCSMILVSDYGLTTISQIYSD